MVRLLLSVLVLVNINFSQSYANDFSYLDVKCTEENATPAQLNNAGMMFGMVLIDIENKREERMQEGKKLDVVLVARGRSTVSKDNILIKNTASYDKMRRSIEDDKSVQKQIRLISGPQRGARSENKNLRVQKIKERAFIRAYADKDRQEDLGFAHMGILFRDEEAEDGWRFVHLLSPCNSNKSRVYNEGLARFFIDKTYNDEYGAWIMIPTDEIQDRLKEIINNTTIANRDIDKVDWKIKPPTYNLVASLDRPSEGNSNSFPLYALALAIDGRTDGDYKIANKLVKQQGFVPSRIFLRGIHQLAAQAGPQQVFVPKAVNFRSSDHPFTKYYPVVNVNSAQSIRDHMANYQILEEDYQLYLPAAITIKD